VEFGSRDADTGEIGLYWGRLGDKHGRRPVALAGMLGMTISCVVMGFSNGLVSCALIRAFAGLMSSSIRVSTATMIGDVSETSSAKARNFSRLPLVATGGVIGPLLQALLAHRFSSDNKIWKTFPILSSQLACASLMFIFFLVNLIFLQEVCGAYFPPIITCLLTITSRRYLLRHRKFLTRKHSCSLGHPNFSPRKTHFLDRPNTLQPRTAGAPLRMRDRSLSDFLRLCVRRL